MEGCIPHWGPTGSRLVTQGQHRSHRVRVCLRRVRPCRPSTRAGAAPAPIAQRCAQSPRPPFPRSQLPGPAHPVCGCPVTWLYQEVQTGSASPTLARDVQVVALANVSATAAFVYNAHALPVWPVPTPTSHHVTSSASSSLLSLSSSLRLTSSSCSFCFRR